jgi:signal transduction histidine kinase/CheY-like chemotaxis protein
VGGDNVWHQYNIHRLMTEDGETSEFQAVIQDRIHPDDRAKVEQACARFFSDGQKLDVEFRFHHKDGRWIWLHNRACAGWRQNGELNVEGILSDITRRKEDEQALQHSMEVAKAANRAKSQFLATMSHELRTPLNAIIGFSEILGDQTFGSLNERQLKYAGNILNSGRHLLQLINDILDLSKVEAGRLELTLSTFGVTKVLHDVQAIVRTLANKKSIQLEIKVADNLPPLYADEAKFKQIMFNLLSNALKFTPTGGCVTVTATVESAPAGTEVTTVPADLRPWLRVVVTDTGIGVQPKDQERIFVEFEQVDSSYGRQQQGTGLGLALTKRLVELHGGRIWVESEGVEGRGSQFVFRLPAAPAPANAPVQAGLEPAEPEGQRPMVLIWSSEVAEQNRIHDKLKAAGYEGEIAATEAELTQRLRTRRPYAFVVGAAHGNVRPALPVNLPANLPVIICTTDVAGNVWFRRHANTNTGSAVLRPRLADALRPNGSSAGPEVKTVLVIDDEPALLTVLTQTLVRRGFHVLQAANGRAGLDLATRHHPGVIVLDLLLPDMSGQQIAERLRAHPHTRNIPILIQTGIALNAEERQHLATHVQSITAKTDPEKLLSEVERWDENALLAGATEAN